IFQQGHGSDAIWGLKASDAIIAWIPLMIFAFLYGLSMDYEVFMLARMREAYDKFGDTGKAIEFGLPHRQARDERRPGADAGVLLALAESGPRRQAVRDRARRRDHHRRHPDPRTARAVADAPLRPLELVVPRAARQALARAPAQPAFRDGVMRRDAL